MTTKLKADRPFSLEKLSDHKVRMNFQLHALPVAANGRWLLPLFLIVIGGSALLFLIPTASMLSGGALMLSGGAIWTVAIGVVIYIVSKSRKAATAQGSSFNSLIFTKNSVETVESLELDRVDINKVWIRKPDTEFLYKTKMSYEMGKARGERDSETKNSVGVTYGTQDILLTHASLNPHQAEKIRDAVLSWCEDPETFLNTAKAA